MKILTPISTSVLFLAFTTSMAFATPPGYLQLKKTEVKVKSKDDQKKMDLEIKTQKTIPVDGKSGAFGYAALTDGMNNVFVMVTHLPLDDSSYENPGSGFHSHVLDLKKSTAACPGANFEVDIENSKKNAAFDAKYKWEVEGKEIEVEDIPVTSLGDAGVETIASFTLKPIVDKDKKLTHLCVTVLDQN